MAAAKKAGANTKKAPTKSQIYTKIADDTGLTKKDVAAVFDSLSGQIKKNERAIVISTAHGLKFTDFKVRYHESKLEDIASELANPPAYVSADANAVKDEIAKRLGL